MFDSLHQFILGMCFFIPVTLGLISWVWTIVIAFKQRTFGAAILIILLPIWAVVYQLTHLVRCRIPLTVFVVGVAIFTLGWNLS
jgi:hypothetical protein